MQHPATSTQRKGQGAKQTARGFYLVLGACLVLSVGIASAEDKPAVKISAAKPRATAKEIKAALANPSAKTKAAAKTAAPDEAKVLRKIVEGKITSVTKRSISVEYETKDAESNEMLLPFGSSVAVEGVKALSEFKPGDHVKIGVEQSYKDVPSGDRIILKTEALVVALVNHVEDVKPVVAQ